MPPNKTISAIQTWFAKQAAMSPKMMSAPTVTPRNYPSAGVLHAAGGAPPMRPPIGSSPKPSPIGGAALGSSPPGAGTRVMTAPKKPSLFDKLNIHPMTEDQMAAFVGRRRL